MIEARKTGHMAWASANNYRSRDSDPEATYEVFMGLLQRIIDDHHSPTENARDHLHTPLKNRMVPIPRSGTWQWDIIEQDLVTEHSQSKPREVQSDVHKDTADNSTYASTSSRNLGPKEPQSSAYVLFFKDPRDNHPAEFEVQCASTIRRDEFEWVSLGLLGADHLMIDGYRVMTDCTCSAS